MRLSQAGLFAFIFLFCVSCFAAEVSPNAAVSPAIPAGSAQKQWSQRGFDFIENRGQWPTPARFTASKGPLSAAFEPRRIAMRLAAPQPVQVALVFETAARAPTLSGEAQRATHYNYFVGNDRTRWRAQVPAYQSLLYRGLYPGVDLRVREHAGMLEYDVLLAAGADLNQVVIQAEGVQSLKLAADGALLLATPHGVLRQTPPNTWEVLPDGARREVAAQFRLIDATRYGFSAPARDEKLALVIDPGLDWSGLLGGTMDDWVNGVDLARDGTGDVFVAGVTSSGDFPLATSGSNSLKPYVARLSGNGSTLRYVTYLAGSASGSYVGRLAADASGGVAVVGYTSDATFPVTPGAYQSVLRGTNDAYVARLNSTGALMASTLLGGSADEAAAFTSRGIAFDPSGAIIVAGVTLSADFPTTVGAFDRTFNPPNAFTTDTFIARFNANLSQLTYASFFAAGAWIKDMVVDPSGFVTVVGETGSGLPTTTGALDRVYNNGVTGVNGEDGFVARFKLDGAGAADLKYSTFLGGLNRDEVSGLAFNPTDPELVTVVGWTWQNAFSRDFPTTAGSLRPNPLASSSSTTQDPYVQEAFVSRFRFPAVGGGSLVWSTFLGGSLWEHASDVAVDAAGNAIVLGGTRAFDFPTTRGAFDRTLGGVAGHPYDCFVARISADGSQLLYSTLLGGSSMVALANNAGTECEQPANNDEAHIVYAGGDSVIVVGETKSADFPTAAGAFDTTYAPGPAGFAPTRDTFVARLTLTADASGDVSVAAPVLLSPANGAALPSTSNVTFSWHAVADPSGIEAYNYQVSSRADFPDSFIHHRGSVSTNSVSLTGLALVTWYWRVQAADRAGNLSAWSPAFSVNLGSAPAVASLSAVSVNPSSTLGGNSVQGTVSLTSAAPAGGAVVSLTDNSASVSVPASLTVAAGASSASFTVATSQVSASTSATITASYAGVNRTTTLTVTSPSSGALPAPALLSPANDARVNAGQNITFDWGDVVGAVSYALEIDDSSTFGAPLVFTQTVSASQLATNTLPARRLWWRVRANPASGNPGAWSATRRIEVR